MKRNLGNLIPYWPLFGRPLLAKILAAGQIRAGQFRAGQFGAGQLRAALAVDPIKNWPMSKNSIKK